MTSSSKTLNLKKGSRHSLKSNKPIKVLHITTDLDGGGVDRLLYDYSEKMLPDIVCDFAITANETGILEGPLKHNGSKIFRIPKIRENVMRRAREIDRIIKRGNYDIIHDHGGYKSLISMIVAKRNHITCRIAHSHIAGIPETKLQYYVRKCLTTLTKHFATDLYACGNDAAVWMWGKNAKETVNIMPNSIRVDEFNFSLDIRNNIREQLQLADKLVVGNVARFSCQKNHSFMISVFAEVIKLRSDAVLLLIGRGELLNHIKQLVSEYKLNDNVLFLGVRNDVSQLLNAMDVFFLPSIFEGLPVVLVEAQANGLPVITSTSVTSEIALTPNFKAVSLQEGPKIWAQAIIEASQDNNRSDTPDLGIYDINRAASAQKKKYEHYLEKN